ncbi:hypothetical protein MUP65_02550, partial [Patescibacteria group bacterium]|nr:hypothetical protein [Patescibacteria group bacterium]
KDGKKTFLMAKALVGLSKQEARKLGSFLGRADLNEQELKIARQLVIKSGAIEACRLEAQRLVEKGKQAIGRLTTEPDYQQVLTSLADYLITREK